MTTAGSPESLELPETAELSKKPAQPVVLWGNDPRRGRLVVACCELASDLGVQTGMTVSQADSLVQVAEGGAMVLPHDSEADDEALEELAQECADRISPLVALEPLDEFLWAGQVLHQPQALLMDVTGVGEWFGSEQRLIFEAQRLLTQLGYRGRIAIADTAGAAWAVARCAPTQPNITTQSASQLTTQHSSPGPSLSPQSNHLISDAWIIPPREQRRAIGPLRVAGLRVPLETTSLLRRLGIQQIEGVLRLPRASLVSRFGKELLLRLDQALGDVDEPLPIHHQSPSDRIVVDLEYPTADLDIIGHQLERMLRSLTTSLASRGRGALRLSCRLECQTVTASNQQPSSNQQPLEIRLGLFNPTAAMDHLLRLLLGDLQRRRVRSAVQRLILTATMTGKLGARQTSLNNLLDSSSSSLLDLARLVDSLSGRLGRQRVLGAQLTHDPLPEQALRLRPLTGQPLGKLVPGRPLRRKARSKRGPLSKAASQKTAMVAEQSLEFQLPKPIDPLRRPLFLLKKPIVITPLEVPDDPQSQPPVRYKRAGKVERVVRFWGPERLETGWWSGPMQRRQYFRIENEQGQWLWIYHDLRDNQWYAHGLF